MALKIPRRLSGELARDGDVISWNKGKMMSVWTDVNDLIKFIRMPLPEIQEEINGTGKRWYGEGEPGTVVGSAPGDEYVDMLTGQLYVLS